MDNIRRTQLSYAAEGPDIFSFEPRHMGVFNALLERHDVGATRRTSVAARRFPMRPKGGT